MILAKLVFFNVVMLAKNEVCVLECFNVDAIIFYPGKIMFPELRRYVIHKRGLDGLFFFVKEIVDGRTS